MQNTNYLLAILPEVFILLMACTILMIGVFLPKRQHLPYYLTQLTLIIAMGLSFYIFYLLGANPIQLFNDCFILDKLALVLKLFIYAASFMVFLYSRYYNEERNIPACEYYVLGLLSILGMMVLVSSHNLIVLFLGLELFSLPVYAMVALQRGKARCIEAAIKYFVIGSLASGMLLYGISLIFGVTKTLDIVSIAQTLATVSIQHNLMLVFGLVFVMAGLAFKFGAAPFHMWVPDVYDGAPTSTTLFLSTAPKLAAFGMAIRLLLDTLPSLTVQWSQILIVISLFSIVIGNMVAVVQTNIKRMLAYSSIAHMGYMLLGLACLSVKGYAAALFYSITYVLMTLGAFGMVVLMGRAGVEANEIEDYYGLNDRNPWLAFIMMLIMFSLAGVPPLVGFIAKVGIIQALIDAHLVWLAVVAVLFSIIGAYYYIRVIKVMYFESVLHAAKVTCPRDLNLAISINGLLVLLVGIFPGPLFALCDWIF